MSRSRGKPRSWSQNPLWRTHSFACYDVEWDAIREAAGLRGCSVNGWVRLWLKEAVLYERAVAKEGEESGELG